MNKFLYFLVVIHMFTVAVAFRVVLNVPVAGRPLNVVVGNVDIVFGLSWHFAGPTEERNRLNV